MFTRPLARETRLPPAQQRAAIKDSDRPSGVAPLPAWARITPSPPIANSRASNWCGRTCSPVRAMDRPMVKNTWACMTSDASPGEIEDRMAMNNRPNWPAPISRP